MCNNKLEQGHDLENMFSAYVKQVIVRSRQKFEKSYRTRFQHEMLTITGDIEELAVDEVENDSEGFVLERCTRFDYSNIENIFAEEKLYRAVKRLKMNFKLTLYLIYVVNKSETEVAEIMGVSRQRVNKVKRDALRKIISAYIEEVD
jgi:DNA-directed RNA polymerase specialized sigma subunit